MGKTKIGILYGGKSAEHEVSIQSALSVVEAIDKEKYELTLIGVDRAGRWFINDLENYRDIAKKDLIKFKENEEEIAIIPGESSHQLINLYDNKPIDNIDIIFPVLHGPFGEDGTIQGLLKITNLPFVGAGVVGSAVGMDKDIMKRLLRDANIPIADYLTYNHKNQVSFMEVKDKIGLPCFIKPANLGSSVGVTKIDNKGEFNKAIDYAFEFDRKIIVEEYIKGREIECSVLGNQDPKASLPGEIFPEDDFYSYEAKYIDENGARLSIPAELNDNLTEQVQGLAIKTFHALCCEGMARVDFFINEENKVFVNEINTIPGFTKISMYSKLWEVSGISYSSLINKLVNFSLKRHGEEKCLKTKI
jgi:D-alanine-D-alanine ligase